MKYQKILVPYDASDPSKAAFSVARDLVIDEPSATLYVVNVVPMYAAPVLAENDPVTGAAPAYIDPRDYAEMFEKSLNDIKAEMMEEVGELLDGLPESQVVYDVVSHPSTIQALTDYVTDHDCDLVIMGRRGLGAIRGMLGSVSHGLLRALDIPVISVK